MPEKIIIKDLKKANPIALCKALEDGNILFFPNMPFKFSKKDRSFLLKQAGENFKEIFYKPIKDSVVNSQKKDREQFYQILKGYSTNVNAFLGELLAPYKDRWFVDKTSFHPPQKKKASTLENGRLNLDVLPDCPTHGKRILRFFTNIDPKEPRNWMTGNTFTELVEVYGKKIGFPQKLSYSILQVLLRRGKKLTKNMGFPTALRSPFDEFMLKFQNYLKENASIQEKENCWTFPPNSCWLAFTDQITHAAACSQNALEQMFFVPKEALIQPEKAPISLIERLTGYLAVNPEYS